MPLLFIADNHIRIYAEQETDLVTENNGYLK